MKAFTVSKHHIITFRANLLRWYRREGRDLPWRHTHNPYHILVSEIMLQQTQVDRVKEKYTAWLERFPTVDKLATASTTDVLTMWSGLGYNRRALALQSAAQQIVNDYGGMFPDSVEELMKLKGVGRYTASAVAAFAFKQPVPIVDTNVKRVLGRIFFGYKELAAYINSTKTDDAPFWELKKRAVPNSKNSYDFNQGIMDFGATVCTAKKPSCGSCPMRTICSSYPEIQTADANTLRVKKKRTEPKYFGQPRRIWRGRILTLLKEDTNHSITLSEIGNSLQTDWEASRTAWLSDVVDTMVKDQLVTRTGKQVKLA